MARHALPAGTLEADGLGCLRGDVPVFAGVRFALEPGDALVLRGPNGSGKSSLLRVLAGLLPPAAGRLFWNGEAIDPGDEAHRGRLAYLGHADALKPVLTARENLAFWAKLHGAAPDGVDAALDRLDLRELADTPVGLLSAGQRRRLAIARIVASPAAVWLLDEPGVSLDAAAVHRLAAALAAHRAAGGIVVAATHQPLDLAAARELDMRNHEPAPLPPEAIP
ncbi:heme exporter protein A [Limimonas halophila]|uniref:Heme exporter protein A n=1 Tax=Limimonas halophila TaxID=1082479 RepID=A0A1G7RNC0_9PROT|nr:heme ABC exporter ATP-binding protein CcmA [Limimonas halophila]SDG12134.1 heme exporter protein A [Limimonas halophila]